MTGLVTVRRHPPGTAAAPATGGLTVTLRWGVRRVTLTATPGAAGPLGAAGAHPAGPRRRPTALDEHFVLDTDSRPGSPAAVYADVLTGSRLRTAAEARAWLATALARHPGAALAAVPLAEGGWAVAGAAHPGPLVLGPPGPGPARGPGQHPLLPSCLHACLVLVPGATLRGLAAAAMTVTDCRGPYPEACGAGCPAGCTAPCPPAYPADRPADRPTSQPDPDPHQAPPPDPLQAARPPVRARTHPWPGPLLPVPRAGAAREGRPAAGRRPRGW
ncbi:hypothetical protein ACWERV_06950 [Streptomyces sp. NPDC004031]